MAEITEEKKKMILGALVGLGVLVIISGSTLLLKRQRQKAISSLSKEPKEEKQEKLLVWEDQAGFTFEYPEDLKIDDHPEDKENYAHLEITSTKETKGKIIILVSDALTKTIDEWVKDTEKASEANVIDTTLGGQPAKKLLLTSPKKILTAAIDPYEGLFLLEVFPGEGEYWSKVYDQILTSFAFKPLTEGEEEILEETGGGGAGGGNVVYEEEEVIE